MRSIDRFDTAQKWSRDQIEWFLTAPSDQKFGRWTGLIERERLIVASNGPKVGSVRGIRENPGKVSVRRNFLEYVKKVQKLQVRPLFCSFSVLFRMRKKQLQENTILQPLTKYVELQGNTLLAVSTLVGS